MHWRDLDSSEWLYDRHDARYAISGDAYQGLLLAVDAPTRPALRVEFATPVLFRIVVGDVTILWGRIDEWWSSVELLRDAPIPRSVIAPLRAHDIDAIESRPSSVAWQSHWSRAFARELANTPLGPLHRGNWLLVPAIDGGATRAPRPAHAGAESPEEPTRGNGMSDPIVAARYIRIGYSERVAPVVRLRPRTAHDTSRVTMWRKRARDGSLPPLLALYMSPISAYLLLDGHDRMEAAREERISPSLIALIPVREKPRVRNPRIERSVLDAAGLIQTRGVSPDAVNRIVTHAFDDRPHRVPMTRAWPMPGGAGAWREGVHRASEGVDEEIRASLVLGVASKA